MRIVVMVLTKVSGLVMGLVGSVLVSRILGPEGRGSYAVTVTLATTAIYLGHLSVGMSVVALWGREGERERIAVGAVVLGCATGLVAAGAAWFVARIGWPTAFEATSVSTLAMAMVAVPLGTTAINLTAVLLVDGQVARVSVGQLLAAALQTFALVVAALLDWLTVTAVILIWAVNTAVPLVTLVRRRWLSVRKISRNLAFEMLHIGIRFHLALAASHLLFRLDIFLLNAEMGRREVGLYSLAVSLVELVYVLTDSVSQVALRGQATASIDQAGFFTVRVARTNVVLAVAGLGCMLISGPVVVPWVFGAEFGPAMEAIVALAPGIVALAAVRPVGAYLARRNKPMLVGVLYLVALGINVALNLVLIPVVGIVGAGLASTIAYVVLAAMVLAWLLKVADLPVSALVPRRSDIAEPLGALASYAKARLR